MKRALVWTSLLLAMSATPTWAQSPTPRLQPANPDRAPAGHSRCDAARPIGRPEGSATGHPRGHAAIPIGRPADRATRHPRCHAARPIGQPYGGATGHPGSDPALRVREAGRDAEVHAATLIAAL